jgi:hypothetical protein
MVNDMAVLLIRVHMSRGPVLIQPTPFFITSHDSFQLPAFTTRSSGVLLCHPLQLEHAIAFYLAILVEVGEELIGLARIAGTQHEPFPLSDPASQAERECLPAIAGAAIDGLALGDDTAPIAPAVRTYYTPRPFVHHSEILLG